MCQNLQAYRAAPRGGADRHIHSVNTRGGVVDVSTRLSPRPCPTSQRVHARTCLKCSIILNLPPIYQDFAASQDIIGWDRFVMGMVSHKLLPLQSAISLNSKLFSNATRWISGLITHLPQVTHTQWIYQCVLVHDRTTGILISAHKEELLKEVEYQLRIGPDGLDEQDRFLLECNFDKLATTTGEYQEYWLLAIVAAREVSGLRLFWDDTERQQEHVRGRDGH
jgi:hypothetical protein